MNQKFLSVSKNLFNELNLLNDEKSVRKYLDEQGLNTKSGTYMGYDFEWVPFGNMKGAMSAVTALNEVAVCALTEHITNSFEAVLQKHHCSSRPKEYVDMMNGDIIDSDALPQSINEAMQEYMGYDSKHYHQFNKLDKHSKSTGQFNTDNELHSMSEVFIQHNTTSNKYEDTLSIFDYGIGQSPQSVEKTIYSSGSDSYKLHSPYLTGRHNMGQKGAFNHQGGRRYQLTASKLAPCMSQLSDDPNKNQWVWSIAQVLDEDELSDFNFEKIRNSMLLYLKFKVDGHWVMPMFDGTFEAVQQIEKKGKSLKKFLHPEFGTYKKFFNFQTGNGIKKISHLTSSSVTGRDGMPKLKSVLNFSYPSVVCPVRFFSPSLDYKTDGGNTSIMLGLEYELESKFGKMDVEKWEVGSINFQGSLVPAVVYKYNKKSQLDHSGIIWQIYGNHVMESPMSFTHSDFKLQSIQKNILLVVNFNSVPLGLRNKLLTTGRETFRSTDVISNFRTYLGKEIQAMPEIQEFILSQRKQTLAQDHAAFKKLISKIFKPKHKKALGEEASEVGIKGNNCDGDKLSNVISWMEVDESTLHLLASEDDPEETILTKVVGSCHKTFKLYWKDDAKESFWTKHGMNVEVEFHNDSGEVEVLTGQDLFMVKKGDGFTMLSVSQSDKFRGESFTAHVKFSPKNAKKCDHPTFEFNIPCLSQYRTQSVGGSSTSTPKKKDRKGKHGACGGINLVQIDKESELADYITSVTHKDGVEELVPMSSSDAFGYSEDSRGRVWAVNMLNPNVKKWKKLKSSQYDENTLNGLYLAFVDGALTSVEIGTRKRQASNPNYHPNIDSLNDEHSHKIMHWELTFSNQIEQEIDKKVK